MQSADQVESYFGAEPSVESVIKYLKNNKLCKIEELFKKAIDEYNIDEEDLADVIEKIDYDKNINSKEVLLEKIRAAFEAYKKYNKKNQGKDKWGIYVNMPDAESLFEIIEDYYYDKNTLYADLDYDTLFDVLEGTSSFDDYVNDIKRESYLEGYNDAEENYNDFKTNDKILKYSKNTETDSFLDMFPDELWQLMSNKLHVSSYYNKDELMLKIDELINKLKKSIYYQNK